MSHRPILIQNLTLQFPHKDCFKDFSTHIYPGDRIGIIGRNGSGKSCLLQIIIGNIFPSAGAIHVPKEATFGYVPQIIQSNENFSGGERFNKALSKALSAAPDLLLLDEPTNHLDYQNRQSLLRMLKHYQETYVIVSHDVELLKSCINTLWHIENDQVHIFHGNYDDYQHEQEIKRQTQLEKLSALTKKQKKARTSLTQELVRAAKSKKANCLENDRNLKGAMKESGSRTIGKQQGKINQLKDRIDNELQEFHLPEEITYKFNLIHESRSSKNIITISEGSCGYDFPILHDINLSLQDGERLAISGANGSGKSTLVKAILNDPHVTKYGNWHVPCPQKIGYLDQHYATLIPDRTVSEMIGFCQPSWNQTEIRRHLNDFLFRKNEEVAAKVSILSGGEKTRLSLSIIAAKQPRLLILDEITNNLDLETRTHVFQVLKYYPGALLIISHDKDFLKSIGIERFYQIL